MITFGSDVGDIILQRTLGENIQGLSLAIERMTSGYKVNHAKDNAAGYSIITDLNTKISSMLQVQQNTEDGIAMLQTAEGGLEEIQGLLERLRALAQQASNGSYGADERESMQAEADEIIAEIARIRDTMQYNGMNLYETPRNEDIVTTSLNRLSASARVTNAGEIYPKKTNNDTQSSPAAFTLAVGGGVNTLSSSSSVSLLSNDTIEGAVDLGASESKTINIDGVEYTIRNKNTTANSLSYIKDTTTGQITFLGSSLEIRSQNDVSHNIVIQGRANTFYGGDLGDRIEIVGTSSTSNGIYGEGGDDIIIDPIHWATTSHGGDGNDTFYLSGAGAGVYGDAGDDTFYLSSIRINVWGGAGDDVFELQAGAGNNRLYGEEGEDTFNIQGSNNTVYGGEGTNAINDNGSGTVSVDVPGANSSIVDLAARETKEVVINGIKYTVSNKSGSSSQSLIYSLNADGSIKFQGSSLTITGEANKAHNVVLELSNSTFYGGNLSDNITSRGQSASNIIYGGAGDDIIQASTSSNLIYGGAGLTLLELRPQIIRFLLRVEMII